jgi:lactate dehydrogenase-like 2-hydroxyacid dehydrogenase
VTTTPDVLTDATADLAWTLILAAARRVAEADRFARSGEWTAWSGLALLGAPVAGRTLGIVGLGAIGTAVARRARGFDMPVLYTNRHRNLEAEQSLITHGGPPPERVPIFRSLLSAAGSAIRLAFEVSEAPPARDPSGAAVRCLQHL